MTHYRAGAEFERSVRAALEEEGYEVIRSAGSKGVVDLAAFKLGQALFVQAKINGKISPAERVRLLHLAALIDAVPLVAWKQPRKAKVEYSRLTGPAAHQREPWHPDIVHVDGIPRRQR